MNVGVVYAVMHSPGGRYFNEALESIASLKVHNPGIKVQLVTDDARYINVDSRIDKVTVIANDAPKRLVLRAKIDALATTAHDRSLFLDTDTYVCGDLSPLGSILNHYDIAMAYAPRRRDPEWAPPNVSIPEWLPEFNSGVILMRKSERTARLLQHWRQLYMEYEKWNDQIALRTAIFHGLEYGLKVYPLPPEYNCRTLCMAQLGSKAYILHGRGDMHKIASQVNSGNGIRVYIPDIGIWRRKDWEYMP